MIIADDLTSGFTQGVTSMKKTHIVLALATALMIFVAGCTGESPKETPKTSIPTTTETTETTTATPVEDEADAFMHEARDNIPSVVDMSLSSITNLIEGVCKNLHGDFGPITMPDLEDQIYNGWDHWNNPGEVRSFITLSQKYYCPETL